MPRIRKPHKTTMTTACIHPLETSNARLAEPFMMFSSPRTHQCTPRPKRARSGHWEQSFLAFPYRDSTGRFPDAATTTILRNLTPATLQSGCFCFFRPSDSQQKSAILQSFHIVRKRALQCQHVPSRQINHLVLHMHSDVARDSLILLCHKRGEQQNGQQVSCLSRDLARRIRSVAMECGLCRSARTRCAAGPELGRNFRGA